MCNIVDRFSLFELIQVNIWMKIQLNFWIIFQYIL